jgi:hypothetical protein
MVESWACLIRRKNFGPYSELGVPSALTFLKLPTDRSALANCTWDFLAMNHKISEDVSRRHKRSRSPRRTYWQNEPEEKGRYELEKIKRSHSPATLHETRKPMISPFRSYILKSSSLNRYLHLADQLNPSLLTNHEVLSDLKPSRLTPPPRE